MHPILPDEPQPLADERVDKAVEESLLKVYRCGPAPRVDGVPDRGGGLHPKGKILEEAVEGREMEPRASPPR